MVYRGQGKEKENRKQLYYNRVGLGFILGF